MVKVKAEQQAIIAIDLKGIRIFLSPYVNPTLKLSKLTAKANNMIENAFAIGLHSFLVNNYLSL